jgi:hypothetical protein
VKRSIENFENERDEARLQQQAIGELSKTVAAAIAIGQPNSIPLVIITTQWQGKLSIIFNNTAAAAHCRRSA